MRRILIVALLLVVPSLAPASDTADVAGSYWYVIDHITQVDEDARVQLWLSLPGDRPGQDVRIRNIVPKPTGILVDAAHGNRVAYWDLAPETVDETLFVHYEFDARLSTVGVDVDPAAVEPYDRDSELYRRYTAPGELIGTVGEIAAVARRIAGDDENAWIRAGRLFDWMVENLEFAPNGLMERSALGTLQSRQGDCGQFSRLFAAMCRSLGIPARTVVTYWLAGGLHHLAEFYLPPYGWVPVDISVAQVFQPGQSQFTPEEAARFAEEKGIPVEDPHWSFGHMPGTQIVLAVGADVELESDDGVGSARFALLAPGGDMAVPPAVRLEGLGDDCVTGGFMAWGPTPTVEAAQDLAYQMLAGRFLSKGLYEAAEQGCLKSQASDPGDVTSWINLGLVNLRKGDYNSAEACFNRALRAHSTGRTEKLDRVIWVHNYLGNCYDLMDRRKLAVAQYAEVAERDNDYRGAVAYARTYLARPFTEADFR